MYFSDNYELRQLERLMTTIPNFRPRGHGVVILRRYEYTEKDCDCIACPHHISRKKGCGAERCPCIEERITAGAATLKEAVAETLSAVNHPPFEIRLNQYLNESEVNPMTFKNERHRTVFTEAVAKLDKKDYALNTQLTIFGGFAPNSSSAEVLSKALGSRTVMSGSVSRNRNDPSESLQMIERPLLTPDELKSLPKGQFVVMKTGVHPMRVKLKLFFKWGIEFDEDNPYAVPDHGGREVQYAEKKEIMDGIIKKYHPDWIVKDKPAADGGNGISGQDQAESESHEPQQTPPKKPGDKKGGGGMNPVPPNRRTALKPAQEVKQNEPS